MRERGTADSTVDTCRRIGTEVHTRSCPQLCICMAYCKPVEAACDSSRGGSNPEPICMDDGVLHMSWEMGPVSGHRISAVSHICRGASAIYWYRVPGVCGDVDDT